MAILRQFSDIVAFFNDHIANLESMIKYLDITSRTTDANGFAVWHKMDNIIPIFAVPSASNQRFELFYANNYWYIFAMSDTGTKLANTSISGRIYYLDKSYVSAGTP